MEASQTYKIKVICSNCGLAGKEIDVPKGMPIDEAECPQCGNVALRRYQDVVIG